MGFTQPTAVLGDLSRCFASCKIKLTFLGIAVKQPYPVFSRPLGNYITEVYFEIVAFQIPDLNTAVHIGMPQYLWIIFVQNIKYGNEVDVLKNYEDLFMFYAKFYLN